MTRTPIAAGFAALFIAGCGGDGKITTHKIEGAGVSIEAPESWKVESRMEGFYSLKGDGGFVQIMTSEMSPPKSLEDAAKSCKKVADKATLPSGAFYVLCDDEVMEGVKTQTVQVTLVVGGASVECAISTDKKVEKYKKICQSMKPL